MDEEVARLEAELLQKKKVAAEVKELRRREAEEKRRREEEAKKQEEEAKRREEEERKKQQETEIRRKQEAEEARRKQEAEETRKKREVEEARRRQEEAEEELWEKSGGESGGDVGGKSGGASMMRRCDYCTKKNTACHWPSAGSKAHSCSQCREHKVLCVVGGEANKKRKERGSPEKIVRKKTKTAESVARSSSSKDVTPAGLDINQQLILELQVIHCTLCAIHMTLKEVSLQVDPDWSRKKESSSLSSEEEEESGKEPEEKGEENPEEEMTLDDEVVELAKEKAQNNKD